MKSLVKMVVVCVMMLSLISHSNTQDFETESRRSLEVYSLGVAVAELGIQILDLSEVEKLHFLDGIERGVTAESMVYNDDVATQIIEHFLGERQNVYALSKRSELMQEITTYSALTERFKTQVSGFVIGFTLREELKMTNEEVISLLTGLDRGFYDRDVRGDMQSHCARAEGYMLKKADHSDVALMLHYRLTQI